MSVIINAIAFIAFFSLLEMIFVELASLFPLRSSLDRIVAPAGSVLVSRPASLPVATPARTATTEIRAARMGNIVTVRNVT